MSRESDAKPSLMPYPWQRTQWQMLTEQIDRERLPHAILLAGPEYIGKQQFALALAARLLCEKPVAGFACGGCKQCHLFTAGSHPDVLQVMPEEAGRAIRIDPVRELGRFLAKTAFQGGNKVVLINPAEAMNPNAANALLKNLEEPAAGSHLILVTHELARLLATVRSRCRRVAFPLPPRGEVGDWLSQVTGKPEQVPELLTFAGGRPRLALALLESDLLQQRRDFDTLLDEVAAGETSPLLAAEQCLSASPLMALDWLYQRVSTGIRSGTRNRSTVLEFRFLDKLLRVKERLHSSANPNVNLLWEELMMDWQHLCR